MYYEVYGYHESETAPLTNNINKFGLELEIDDDSQQVRRLLDEAIEDGIITAPENEDYADGAIVIEEDGSVYRELIFCADTISNILDRVETLNNNGINNENICNTDGTSCHIHINRELLWEKGINTTNIYKTIEFYAPLIYALSGRERYEFKRWAEPCSYWETDGLVNWSERGREISDLYVESGNRYQMVNLCNSATVELRAFCNKDAFNYDKIKFNFDFVEFLISESEYMVGRYFKDEGDVLIYDLIEWFKSYHPEVLSSNYELKQLLQPDQALKQLNKAFNNHKFIIDRLKYYQISALNYYDLSHWGQLFSFIENNLKMKTPTGERVTLSKAGFNNFVKKLLNQERQEMKSMFNSYYYMHYLNKEDM